MEPNETLDVVQEGIERDLEAEQYSDVALDALAEAGVAEAITQTEDDIGAEGLDEKITAYDPMTETIH